MADGGTLSSPFAEGSKGFSKRKGRSRLVLPFQIRSPRTSGSSWSPSATPCDFPGRVPRRRLVVLSLIPSTCPFLSSFPSVLETPRGRREPEALLEDIGFEEGPAKESDSSSLPTDSFRLGPPIGGPPEPGSPLELWTAPRSIVAPDPMVKSRCLVGLTPVTGVGKACSCDPSSGGLVCAR